jgi:hypothetical protein
MNVVLALCYSGEIFLMVDVTKFIHVPVLVTRNSRTIERHGFQN